MAYEKIKAIASVTIVDETDASSLTGTMTVVKGSKNQIFLTGQYGADAYSPDWSKDNLVIRPFLQASNVTKQDGAGVEYNPDLFSPEEYGEALYNYDYIKDIHWYLRDSAGVENEIYESSDFSLSYTYSIKGQNRVCSDARQLVIKNNILSKNTTADIVCKFSFYDPFANIYISQQLETNLINIASGQSQSKLVTTCVNGNSVTNNGPGYVDIMAQFFGDNGTEDIDVAIEDGAGNTSCLWYARMNDNWMLLDPREDAQAAAETVLYETMKVKTFNEDTGNYEFEPYFNERGSSAIRIHASLIPGSLAIKCVYTDYTGTKYYSVQTLQDVTDDTRAVLRCSNGKKLKKGIVEDTTVKAVITYKGTLLTEESSLYDTEFDYYWYKYTVVDDKYVNVYNDPTTNDIIENEDLENPVKGYRTLYVDTQDIDPTEKMADFELVLMEKGALIAEAAQASYYSRAISEEDLGTALALNREIGIENDYAAAICTAQELNLD